MQDHVPRKAPMCLGGHLCANRARPATVRITDLGVRRRLLDADARRPDDRPPPLDVGLVHGGERLRVCRSRGKISCPRSVSRARTAGSAKVSTTAALSLATTLAGMPLGPKNPCQLITWKPGRPASSALGMSGAAARRLLSATV